MRKIGFVVLSDLHLKSSEIGLLSKITRALIDDIERLANKHDITIHFLILAGDLVFTGTDSKVLFNAIKKELIDPLTERFNIKTDNIITIPGNHEINRDNIDKMTQLGLNTMINGEGLDDVEYYPQIQKKLREYYNFDHALNQNNKEFIVDSKIFEIEKIKFGITRINTVWNLVGDGTKDVKNIWIPKGQLMASFDQIKNTNIKICIMHHPIDWIHDQSLYNVEETLDSYNIILNGHKHYHKSSNINDVNYIQSRKLGPISNESGYILLAIDEEESKLYKFYRNYIQKSEDFRIAVDVSESEFIMSDISIMDKDNELVLSLIRETKVEYLKSLYKLFVTAQKHDIDKKFDDFFISPKLVSLNNDFVDTDQKEDLLQKAIDSNENLIIQGTEKSGKSILAHHFIKIYYERKWDFLKVPIYIDASESGLKNSNEIINYIVDNLRKLSSDDYSIKKNEIKRLLTLGKMVIVVDNCNDKVKLESIYRFINEYNSCRYIIFRNNKLGYFVDEESIKLELNSYNIKFTIYDIPPLTRNGIRQLYKRISPYDKQNEVFFDKVMKDMDSIGLTRTPFNATLILFVYNNDLYGTPSNQTKVIEQFLETILEKLNPSDRYYSSYDFENKEDFLANLANIMFEKGKYMITLDEFNEFVFTYHKNRGFDVEKSMFDKLFFDKMILIKYNGGICFRFEFMFHYYLAKYALRNEAVYTQILNDFLNFEQEIIHISGLRRDDKSLLDNFIKILETQSEKFAYSDALVESDEFTDSLFNSYKDLKEIIDVQSSMPEEDIDGLTDVTPQKNGYDPHLSIKDCDFTEIDKLGSIIKITASVAKNTDNIDDIDLKEKAIVCVLDGVMRLWNATKVYIFNMIKDFDKQEFYNKLAQDGHNPAEIKEIIEKSSAFLQTLISLSIPIAIETELFYQISTQKLSGIIKKIRDSQQMNKPEQLILQLLSIDMQLNDWLLSMKEYISKTEKNDYLRVLFFKLSFILMLGKSNENEVAIKKMQHLIAQKFTGDKNVIVNYEKLLAND